MAARQVGTFSVTLSGTTDTYRLVLKDASGGSYAIERATTDALGATSWTSYASFSTSDSDAAREAIPSKILAAAFDKALGLS